MAGAITILSFDDGCSSAALVGDFTGEGSAFLEQHLDELAGDVVLECEHLEALDEESASTLLAFRRRRDAEGRAVMFRRLADDLRSVLIATAAAQRTARCATS